MTGSINNIVRTKQDNPFLAVSSRLENPSNFYLQTPADRTSNQETVLGSSLDEFVITPDEARKKNNYKLLGISIAGTVLLTAGGLFLLLKGGSSKKLTTNLFKLRDYLTKKVQMDKLKHPADTSIWNNVYLFVANTVNKLANRSEAINNYTSIKDIGFKKIMGIFGEHGKDLHKYISNIFEKIGRKSVESSYESTKNLYEDVLGLSSLKLKKLLVNSPEELIEINGLKMTKKEWPKRLSELNTNLETQFEEHFSNEAITTRYDKYKKLMITLSQKFEQLKQTLLTKDLYKKFIAEETIVKGREEIRQGVNAGRKSITYSIKDLIKDYNDLMLGVSEHLDIIKDKDAILQLANFRKNLMSYIKMGDSKITKEQLLSELSGFKEYIAKLGKDEKVNEILMQDIASLTDLLKNSPRGVVEELLEIYKAVLPKSEYARIEKMFMEFTKSLDKSIKLENEDFVSKLRDITLGSAPTDVLSMVGGVGALGYQLAKTKNNDQRASISLKYGIPALAGIGSSLYFNAKLFAGSKAMIFGALTMAIVNRIGVKLDDIRKKYSSQKV